MSKIYVLLDAMGIQDYIFESNTLKIILGSSLALARWQEKCKKIASDNNGNIIVSAGGNVLANFNSSDDADKFKKICIDKAPPEIEIAWGKKDNAAGDHANVWLNLQKEIARYKAGDRKVNDYPKMEISEVPGCRYCGIRPDDKKEKIEERSVCAKCRTLYQTGKGFQQSTGGRQTSIEKLYNVPMEQGLSAGFPDDLKEMVIYDKENKDLMAAVVIDLNDMGNRIKELVNKNGFDQLKEFSEELEGVILAVVQKAVIKIGQDENGFSPNRFIRLRPIILGGDDIIFLMPARLWPKFVKCVLEGLSNRQYPACAGITVAKHSFPVNRLVLMAEELAASAKGLVRFQKQTPDAFDGLEFPGCALDWHIHQETAFTSPLEVRKRNIVKEVNEPSCSGYAIATQKPYTLNDFNVLQKEVEDIKHKKISNRKLYALNSALHDGPGSTRDTLVYTFLRDENEQFDKYEPLWRRILADNGHPLWKKTDSFDGKSVYNTRITDLLELMWLQEGQIKRNNDE